MDKRLNHNLLKRVLAILLIVAGLLCFLYPTISYIWNGYRDSRLITEYNHSVAEADAEIQADKLESARKYNQKVAAKTTKSIIGPEDPEDDEYKSLLNFSGNGIMGYIEIPKIAAKLPVYHYSNADVLEKGAGHIYGTSLPIGGTNTHSVLTGHRGLASASMLSDLNRLNTGDEFYIHVGGETLAYRVCQIRTVLPQETDSLTIEEGRDLVTLITCTPYAINSHRLLVTGERTEYVKEGAEEVTSAEMMVHAFNPVRMTLFFTAILIVPVGIFAGKKQRAKKCSRSE
ncbi:MAG: class C sortase [Oribacterium sp.]|nr:class C sortase [Oribacterium sp.]